MTSHRYRELKIALGLLALVFLAIYLIRYEPRLTSMDLHRLGPSLGLVLLIDIAIQMATALSWRSILQAFDHRIGVWRAIRVHSRALLARYVPGNIWHVVGIATWLAEDGVPIATAVTTILLENIYQVLGSALIAGAGIPWWLHAGYIRLPYLSLTIGVAIAAALSHPRVFNRITAAALRLLRKPPLDHTFSTRRSIQFLSLYAAIFIGQGLALYILAASVPNAHFGITDAIGMYAISWLVGYLSILTPSGIGVREAVLTILLARVMPIETALVVAILNRVLLIFSELITAALPFGRLASRT